jgi:hypothetical protein
MDKVYPMIKFPAEENFIYSPHDANESVEMKNREEGLICRIVTAELQNMSLKLTESSWNKLSKGLKETFGMKRSNMTVAIKKAYIGKYGFAWAVPKFVNDQLIPTASCA